MKEIQLLDCTLRDGGHLNEGKFGEYVIKYIIQKLVESGIEIIEVGFLWNCFCDKDTARFLTIEDVKRVLPKERGKSKFSLMADFIDLEHLEEYDGTIEYIRLSFKRQRLDWALKMLKVLQDKGYKCFINPVNCNVYSDKEYIQVIEKVNECKPYGFSIVDTFGVMRINDLSSRYYLVENNLSPDIVIGLHLHENLGLAYSLAQHFIEISSPVRDIVIDCSLLGMGRTPGNLCTEQIMDHANLYLGKKYQLASVYDAIDDYIMPLKKRWQWGYSIPYALSAQYKLHRTYAEYLMEKWKLKTSDIQAILRKVERKEAELFNQEYVEQLYRGYMDKEVDDHVYVETLANLLNHKEILLIAPGSSILEMQDSIAAYKEHNDMYIITVNFIPEFLDPDAVFFTNIKRYETEIVKYRGNVKILITSNLINEVKRKDYIFRYGRLAYHAGEYCEDSVLMLLNLLSRIKVESISIAGFDGFKDGGVNFYLEQMDRCANGEHQNENVNHILKSYYSELPLCFITDSIFARKE